MQLSGLGGAEYKESDERCYTNTVQAMRCRPGIYSHTGHTGHGSEFWSHYRHISAAAAKFIPQGEIPEGGSCGVVPNLHFAINWGATAGCEVPAPFSIQRVNWFILAVLPPEFREVMPYLCYPFTWTRCPSLLGLWLCGQTILHCLIPRAGEDRDVLEKTRAQGTSGEREIAACSYACSKCNTSAFVQFWLQLHQHHLILWKRPFNKN